MDYGEAIAVLEKAKEKFEFPVKWGIDLQSEHERYLTEKHAKKPVIVMNYPKDIKAFYMRVNDDGKTVAAMDVLAPGIGEIIGGSQREERLDVLDARMAERAHRQGALRLVPRPAPLRHGAARGLRPRLRAHARLRHRPRQRARRDPVSANAGKREVLTSRSIDARTAGRARPGGHATRGSASVAISSPQIACARRFGWKPSRENRSGSNTGDPLHHETRQPLRQAIGRRLQYG